MVNASSPVLRADTAATPPAMSGANDDAYGSLATLGGPRKFKKRPVLVLDPEELERAHLYFQEASAELLGAEVERPARAPVTLGLAPMDDAEAVPEDMGESDDAASGADDEHIPTAEEVMRMTGADRQADGEADRPSAEDAFALNALESGLDLDHRIFPSLPMRPEEEIAAEEAAEEAAIAARTEQGSTTSEASWTLPDLPEETIDEDEPVDAVAEESGHGGEAESQFASLAPAEPFEPRVEWSDEAFDGDTPQDAALEAANVELVEDAGIAASEDSAAHEPEVSHEAAQPGFSTAFAEDSAPAAEVASQPALASEVTPPIVEQDEPSEGWRDLAAFARDEGYYAFDGSESGDANLAGRYAHDDADEAQAAEPSEQDEGDGNFTIIEDEPVDGYAFMYARNQPAQVRRIAAAAEGNSLRARIMRERERQGLPDSEPAPEPAPQEPVSPPSQRATVRFKLPDPRSLPKLLWARIIALLEKPLN